MTSSQIRRIGSLSVIGIGAALAVAGCASNPPQPSVAPTQPAAMAGGVILEDDFIDDRNVWGVGEYGGYLTASYADGHYVWTAEGSNTHWLPEAFIAERFDGPWAGDPDFTNVQLEADVTIVHGDGVVGLFCHEADDTDSDAQWYEFVARDGFAAIRIGDLENNVVELARTEDISIPTGSGFTIGGRCVTNGGTVELTMSINGAQVLHAADATLPGNGPVGLQAYTFPIHDPLDLEWDRFVVAAS